MTDSKIANVCSFVLGFWNNQYDNQEPDWLGMIADFPLLIRQKINRRSNSGMG